MRLVDAQAAVAACIAFAVAHAATGGGDTIAFSEFNAQRTGCGAIYTMDAEGGHRTRLRANACGAEWSPGRRRIAFSAPAPHAWLHDWIYVMSVDGRNVQRLASRSGSGGLAWSPDGQRIAFSSDRGALYVMNLDGSGVRHLTDAAYNPTWSPDGRKLAFDHALPGDGAAIFEVTARGGQRVRLTNPPRPFGVRANDLDPAWSPDGRTIAFERNTFTGSGYTTGIFLLDVKHHTIRRLTHGGSNQSPTWSPNGHRIAFVRYAVHDHADIWVMNADGSGQHQLTYLKEPIEAGDPAWAS